MNKNITVVLLLVLAAGCSTYPQGEAYPPMDPTRKISYRDCTRPFVNPEGGLLFCREVTEAERRARIAEEERAARERLERERAEQLAREEAARKAQAAEEERLAAERRRVEEEAARKAQEERERQEKLAATLAAEALARQQAEQEAREAAARECRRLEQERSDGRALLADFVAKYGKVDEFKGMAGQISAFLGKPPKVKPCPPVGMEKVKDQLK